MTTDLGDGTVMHCWVPKIRKPSKPNLLLLHGFGANAMWQYGELLRRLKPRFNIYVPDLLFFGESSTTRPERTETFPAECVKRLMEVQRVEKLSVVGASYGGFVGYSMAVQYPEAIEKLILCGAAVCLEKKDMEEGLFNVSDIEEAANILVPQTSDKLKELIRFSLLRPVKAVPSCLLTDFIDVMCTDHVEQKRELIKTILKGRKLSEIPTITLVLILLNIYWTLLFTKKKIFFFLPHFSITTSPSSMQKKYID